MATGTRETIPSNQKVRPYFSSIELLEIIQALKEQNKSKHLIHYLEGFAIKIERGILSPQLPIQPSIEDKLELGTRPTQLDLGDMLTKKKLAAYSKWKLFPSSCSPNELAHAKLYRYENDLMDQEEESEYESHHFG